jgi:hypothetical protein
VAAFVSGNTISVPRGGSCIEGNSITGVLAGFTETMANDDTTVDASLAVQLVNYTSADGRTGAIIAARTNLGASIACGLFTNILAFHSKYGIDNTLPSFANGFALAFGIAPPISSWPARQLSLSTRCSRTAPRATTHCCAARQPSTRDSTWHCPRR